MAGSRHYRRRYVKIITVASLKGGVGKTSTALFLAESIAFRGRRVVLIDADPNNNATDYLARDMSPEALEARSLYAALTGRRKLAECCIPTAFNLSLIPGTPSLARATLELAADPGIALRFPKAVRGLEADVVLVDSPPALTIELTLALYTADIVLVPVLLSRWTSAAYQVVADMVAVAAETTGKRPDLYALPSIVSEREAETLRDVSIWQTTRTAILKTASVKNATNTGKALKASSTAWTWFNALAEELAL
jgi:chromosome partitioning protein